MAPDLSTGGAFTVNAQMIGASPPTRFIPSRHTVTVAAQLPATYHGVNGLAPPPIQQVVTLTRYGLA